MLLISKVDRGQKGSFSNESCLSSLLKVKMIYRLYLMIQLYQNIKVDLSGFITLESFFFNAQS